MNTILGIVVKRLGLGFLTIIVISILIFLGVEALPGDVATAILGQEATPETVAAFRKELKLDLPPHVRYFAWLGDFLRGDMGTSLANKRPISELIFWRFQNTIFSGGLGRSGGGAGCGYPGDTGGPVSQQFI
jgi:peptide/nickel transport system permease protein